MQPMPLKGTAIEQCINKSTPASIFAPDVGGAGGLAWHHV